MRHILIGAIAIVLIFAFSFGSEVSAYSYESVACGPGGTGASDYTTGTGDRDYSTSQWNYQSGTTWWGYRDSSKNGYYSHYDTASGLGVCARAYNTHSPYSGDPTRTCNKADGKHSNAFAGWSSNMQSQQREVYCVN